MPKCPYCWYSSTNHETLDGNKNPKIGEISFCISCGEISKFTKTRLIKQDIRELSDEEQEEVMKIREAWCELNKDTISGDQE